MASLSVKRAQMRQRCSDSASSGRPRSAWRRRTRRSGSADAPPRLRRQHALAAGEGAHQHQQRRARQVEVRDQQVDRAKPVAGQDQQPRPAGRRLESPVRACRGDLLERAHHRRARPRRCGRRQRARRSSAAAVPASSVNHSSCIGCCARVVDRDGAERAGPDVQREEVHADARAAAARSSSSGVKCKPGGGRRGAAGTRA